MGWLCAARLIVHPHPAPVLCRARQNGAIPCNTIALVAGGSESAAQKNAALAFMERLANATGGTYRGLGAP